MLSLAKKLSKFNKIVFFVCFDTNQFLKNKKIKFVKVFLSEKNVRKKQINSKNNTNYLALQKYKNGGFFYHLIRIKNFFYFLRYILIRYFYSYIKYFNNKIDILISPGDRENIFELSLIKFAVNDQKKVFIYPAAVAADPINSIFYRDKHIVKDSDFIKKFPTQIFKHKKKNYSFFGFYHTKIFNFLNILPSNPWTFAAGKNRKLLVTSNILIEYYKSLGTPKKNIRLIKNEKLEKREIIFENLVKRYSFFNV